MMWHLRHLQPWQCGRSCAGNVGVLVRIASNHSPLAGDVADYTEFRSIGPGAAGLNDSRGIVRVG